MSLKDNLRKATVQIALSNPFFASILLRRKIEIKDHKEESITDGETITIGENTADKPVPYIKMTLLNQACKVALGHHFRREGRDYNTWQEASEYVVNDIIVLEKYILPNGWKHDEAYRGMSIESVYRKLKEKKKDGNDQDGDGAGDGPPPPRPINDAPAKTKEEKSQKEDKLKQEIAQAKQMAKLQGKLPAGLEEQINKELYGSANWVEILSAFISEISKSDYNFSRPNTRYLDTGFILPSLYNQELKKVILMVDTSGSMDLPLLQKVAGEIKDIADFLHVGMYIIYCDTKVQRVDEYEPDDELEIKIKGRGGTKYSPAFKHLEDNEVEGSCIVYFTDGECNDFPDKEPAIPTLWAICNNDNFIPPFGEVIHIEN